MTILELLSIKIYNKDGNILPEAEKLIKEIDKLIFTKGGQHK